MPGRFARQIPSFQQHAEGILLEQVHPFLLSSNWVQPPPPLPTSYHSTLSVGLSSLCVEGTYILLYTGTAYLCLQTGEGPGGGGGGVGPKEPTAKNVFPYVNNHNHKLLPKHYINHSVRRKVAFLYYRLCIF
jgi:hypothetical protein